MSDLILNNFIPIITIDGPTASGKGTIAKHLAKVLGFHYLDSGAIYRLTALASVRHGIDPENFSALAALAKKLDIHFENERILLSSEDVTDIIRVEALGNRASAIAIHPTLRAALSDLQRTFKIPPGLVADGRDMGTIVFPEADLKVFLTATPRTRAQRRYKQLIERGFSTTIRNVLIDLGVRDDRDRNRSEAPLRPAEGARVLDTSEFTIEQTVTQVLGWFSQVR
ncbi:(d)CMP kinase [Candidatus Pandoraea novymonadis]|uniref:(d)CMP kinase n=1 Tax=Candidatus Pandoraea novymonadis TaxID=1808959 RepID=UPI003B847353